MHVTYSNTPKSQRKLREVNKVQTFHVGATARAAPATLTERLTARAFAVVASRPRHVANI